MVAAKRTHIITLAVNIIYLYLTSNIRNSRAAGLRTNSVHPRQTMSACDTTVMKSEHFLLSLVS